MSELGLTPEELEEMIDCDHGVYFDREEAEGMRPEQVRQQFPRLEGNCIKCGYSGIAYASMAHYIAGDW